MKAGERIWIDGVKKEIKQKISPALFKKLTAPDCYTDKLFPLLLKPIFLANNSPHHIQLGERSLKKYPNRKKSSQGNWRHNLKKLNELLQQKEAY